MPFAALRFGTAHYRDTGRREAPAVVFVNSLGTDLRIWDQVIDALVGDYRIIAYDKRGHGLSSVPPGDYTIGDLSGDLLELADRLEIDRFALVGISVGGMIALHLAAHHPERLTAVIACDTAARIGDAATWNGRIEAVRRGGMTALADAVLLRWFPENIRAGRATELDGWRNLLLRCPVEGYVGTCAALRDADLTDAVGSIDVPTLVVAGAEDRSTPVDLVRATADRIPGARFVVIDGAGHLPCLDQPARLAQLIDEQIRGEARG